MIGPRQDTFIDLRKAQIVGVEERVHVVETRKDGIDMLYKLALKSGGLGKDVLGKLNMALLQKLKRQLVS